MITARKRRNYATSARSHFWFWLIFLVSMSGCQGIQIRLPAAQTPVLQSTGITRAGHTIGNLQLFCGANAPRSIRPDNVMGFYATLRYPGFTELKATYNGGSVDRVGGPTPQQASVAEGPRPFLPSLISRAQGADVFFWGDAEQYDNATGMVTETIAIIVGAQATNIPVPMPLGGPGCFLLAQPDLVLVFPGSAGAAFTAPIPVIDVTLFVQGVNHYFTTIGFTNDYNWSNGLKVDIG